MKTMLLTGFTLLLISCAIGDTTAWKPASGDSSARVIEKLGAPTHLDGPYMYWRPNGGHRNLYFCRFDRDVMGYYVVYSSPGMTVSVYGQDPNAKLVEFVWNNGGFEPPPDP